eukprot:2073000-Pyramimonas_sp.AAC.1
MSHLACRLCHQRREDEVSLPLVCHLLSEAESRHDLLGLCVGLLIRDRSQQWRSEWIWLRGQ